MAKISAQAQGFIEALEHDTHLQAQYNIAAPNNLDGVVDFASAKGHVFTREELEAALKRYPDSAIVRQLRQYIR
jgi:hypothetical protein